MDFTHFVGKDIQFNHQIAFHEAYPEPAMRATIVSITPHVGNDKCEDPADLVFEVVVDYSKFDELNKAYEQANYYDQYSRPILTAREAGFYNVREKLYFGSPEYNDWDELFTVLDDGVAQLHAMFNTAINEGYSGTYVNWLENQLAASMKE